MKCYFHENKDAVYECTACGKPICEDCLRFNDEDQVVCPACTLEAAIDFADDDVRSYHDKMHKLRQEQQKKKTKFTDNLEYVNGWFLLIILLLIGVNIYLHQYTGRAGQPAFFNTERFAEQADPAPEMSYISAKIFSYANDHKGKFPNKLDDLYPQYLEEKPRILRSEENYFYTTVNGPEGFILNLPRAERYGYRKLFVTGDGVMKIE